MECINVMEQGLLIDYSVYEELSETAQDKYFITDDFIDCDYLKIKNQTVAEIIQNNNNIYYMLVNPDYDMYEDEIQEILLKFYSEDFKKDFREIPTYTITQEEKKEYENTLNSNITLFYRGGAGYYYSVHKLINKELITKIL